MDTSSLKEELVRKYQDDLRGFISIEYQKDISDKVLRNLDDAVAILAEEKQFVTIIQDFDMQIGWLKSTGALVYDVCDLELIPGIAEVVGKMLKADKDFYELFCSLTKIARRRYEANKILKQLRERKKQCINAAYWAVFADQDHHSPTMLGEISLQLGVDIAMVPGTFVHKLIDKRNQLYGMFPDLRNMELDKWLAELRLKFLIDKNPSEMDDFKDKIIHIVQEAVAVDSFKWSATKEKLLLTVEKANAETFSSTV